MKRKRIVFALVITCCLIFSGSGPAVAQTTGPSYYFLLFFVTDYNAKLAEGIEYFFDSMLQPGDNLSVITPVKPYSFSPQTLKTSPKEKLVNALKTVLKRDATIAGNEFYNITDQMKRVIRDINEAMGGVSTSSRMGIGAGATGDLKNSLVQYRQLLSNLDKVRKVSEGLLLKIADIAQKVNAKPYIYIFYQTELRPVPVRLVMDALMQNNDLKFDAQELFLSDKAEKPFEVEKIKQALLDAKAVCNFGYIKSKSIRSQQYDMKDHSQDLYGIFSEMAKATSGLVETTVKPKAVFKKAFEGK